MKRDTLTGILGAAVLVAAMIGVFQYERTVGAEQLGIGSAPFALASLDGPSTDGRTALGESTESTLTLNETGLANVTFTLTWTAEEGADRLTLDVVPPAGVDAPDAVTGDAGRLALTVPVMNENPDGTTGAGAWTVRVTFEDADGVDTPAGRVGGDGEVAWTVSTALDAWRPATDA